MKLVGVILIALFGTTISSAQTKLDGKKLAKCETQFKGLSDEQCRKVASKQVFLGETESELEVSLGKPKSRVVTDVNGIETLNLMWWHVSGAGLIVPGASVSDSTVIVQIQNNKVISTTLGSAKTSLR